MEITSNSKPETSNGSPYADLGYNYLWELVNIGEFVPAFVGMQIFKDGFAKECYSGGFNGVQSRIINTLADMERSFSLERGVLVGRLHFAKLGTFDETLSAEQFFHSRYKPFRVTGLFQDLRTKGEKPVGGSSEFYNMTKKQASARFANSWRKSNTAKGLEIVTHKRTSGIHGCPEPMQKAEEPSYISVDNEITDMVKSAYNLKGNA